MGPNQRWKNKCHGSSSKSTKPITGYTHLPWRKGSMCTIFNSKRLWYEVGSIFRVRKWWRVLKELLQESKLILLNCAQMLCQEHLLKVSIRNSHVNITVAFFRMMERSFSLCFVCYKESCKKHVLEFNTPRENIAFSKELQWFLYSGHKTYITYYVSLLIWLLGISV